MDQEPKRQPAVRTPDGLRLTAPKMTRADWRQRSQTRVTLSRSELEQLAQLIAIGRQVMRDSRPIAPHLHAAMTRLGIATYGL